MDKNSRREKKRHGFLRFLVSGVVNTAVGALLFWLVYPVGPVYAALVTEAAVHCYRFMVFRFLVFPARKGFTVSWHRYIVASLPSSASAMLVVYVLRDTVGRDALTLITTTIAITVGFCWSRFVFTK